MKERHPMPLTNEKYIINKDMTIKEAMHKIGDGLQKTVFLTENGKLKGSLTDGDVRRHLLNGGNIQDNVCKIVNFQPKYFYQEDNVDYHAYMIKNMLSSLPIVDSQMHLIRIEFLSNRSISYQQMNEKLPVVMMAGGLGTRLKPYTQIIPKPLIPIGSKTITEHIFDKFDTFGCNDFYMIVNYKKSLIEAYFKDIDRYTNLKFLEEPFFMGTAGGIQLLRQYINNHFFLVNCDILVDFDYSQIWKKHVKDNNIITIVSAKDIFTIPYGTVVFDENDKVCDLIEKPQMTYHVNTGMYLCNAKVVEYIGNQEKIDMPDLIKRCIQAGESVGQVVIGKQDWYDMGQPEELELMKKRLHII